jgi:sugar phosphate isomerase/epimerase
LFKIATFADWFGVGVAKGIEASAKCGAEGVQLYAWNELNPYEVSASRVAELKAVAEANGQKVTALCGELAEVAPGGRGLEVLEENPPKIEYLKRVFELAANFNCEVVTTHIGVVPEDTASARYHALQTACVALSEYAVKMNMRLAIETGPEPIERLCAFAEGCGGGIALNYDPANLIMVTNVDEVQGVLTAGKKIAHTHAKDGVMRKYIGPEYIYGLFAQGGAEIFEQLPEYFAETPLGQGSVRWREYLNALREVGYDSFLTIEREVSHDPAADIRMAVDFLKDLLKTI